MHYFHVQEEISPGSFVLVDTFLDRTQARQQSFYGGGAAGFTSVAHVPMEPAFCSRYYFQLWRVSRIHQCCSFTHGAGFLFQVHIFSMEVGQQESQVLLIYPWSRLSVPGIISMEAGQ